MSLIFSQYTPATTAGYFRAGGVSPPPFMRHQSNPGKTHPQERSKPPPSEPPAEQKPTIKTKPLKNTGGFASILSGGLGNILPHGLSNIIPKGLDLGDILLLAFFLLLYLESGDSDFLIILIVVGYSILK